MKEIKVKLTEKITRTPTVVSFRFALKEKIDFIPGQFLQIIFDEQNRGNRELNKYLSFSSSPTREYIEVTKRLSNSQFSERLRSLKPGDDVLIKAPMGECVLRDEYKKIAFLIGGIGITPVISIIEYIVDKKLNVDVSLVYSNRTEEEIAFRQELDKWSSIDGNIKIYYIVTERQPIDARCIYASIDKCLLSQKVGDLKQRILFIFGPPRMVEAMKTLAVDFDCSAANIKTEKFIGY